MSSEIERYEGRDSWVHMVQPSQSIAEYVAPTSYATAARGKAREVFAAIMYGRELGLEPFQSMLSMHNIQGRPSLSSEALRALYYAAGHTLYPVEWTAKLCTVHAERADGRGQCDITFTMHDAEVAGLLKSAAWKQYPHAMLYARASAMAIKAIAPDVALGLEVADEPTTVRAEGPTTTVQIQRTPEPQPAPAPPSAIHEEPSSDEGPPMVTPRQTRAIYAAMDELDRAEDRTYKDHEERDTQRRAYILSLAGAQGVEHVHELTVEQGKRAIDALREQVANAREQT